jgi:hypothetical protein
MSLLEALSIALALTAGSSFICGQAALAGANDLHACYWLALGVLSLRVAVGISKPGAKA